MSKRARLERRAQERQQAQTRAAEGRRYYVEAQWLVNGCRTYGGADGCCVVWIGVGARAADAAMDRLEEQGWVGVRRRDAACEHADVGMCDRCLAAREAEQAAAAEDTPCDPAATSTWCSCPSPPGCAGPTAAG